MDRSASLFPLKGYPLPAPENHQFSTRLDGNEFYLNEMRVIQQRVITLPDLHHLEMLRAAGEMATRRRVRQIRDILWEVKLDAAEQALEVRINLKTEKDESFAQLSSGETYRRFIDDLRKNEAYPTKIVHFWANTNTPEAEESLEEPLQKGVFSTLYLTQALMEDRSMGKVDLIHVHTHSSAIAQPQHTAISGFAQMWEVLFPKVHGTLHLDRSTRDVKLDFFLMFSSIAAFGNPGQCDYAFANSFMDQFAVQRQRRVEKKERWGKTLSINWPLWQDGGMQVDSETAAHLHQTLGLTLLRTSTGLTAFETALRVSEPQFLVVEGNPEVIRLTLTQEARDTEAETQDKDDVLKELLVIDTEKVLKKLSQDLIQIVAEQLKIKTNAIDMMSDMSDFGFDSIAFTGFSNQVNATFDLQLTPAIFYEHPTLDSFARFLSTVHKEKIARYYQETVFRAQKMNVVSRSRIVSPILEETGPSPPPESIAIIGMNGVMPQSPDLDTYWNHLADKDSLITEIPQERWDYREYWGDPDKEANRTNIKWGGFMPDIDKFDALLSPTPFISLSKAGMLSIDGRCKTFDETANGYVRGEGCGAILLKPLGRALEDGDHIYAVIKGTAINHGGRARSMTAPNPNAQADLIVNAFEEAQIDPETVTYIETHGTGTSLGDPIEINGLKKAFKRMFKKLNKPLPADPFVRLGAVKPNIGHLETAAGIAGILKVLLAMKHQTIPANIHFKTLNPYIELAGSPFTLATETATWAHQKDRSGREIPLRAGISSFGFGGVNAHILLEEYRGGREGSTSPHQDQWLVPLSAKNRERLDVYIKDLLHFVGKDETDQAAHHRLAQIAWTLQTGREAMEERLAMIVTDFKDLAEKLSLLVQGEGEIDDVFRGNAKTGKNILGLIMEENEGEAFVRSIVKTGNLTKIARIWVEGVDVDWRLLYPNRPPKRIPLPTYPFRKDRYWFKASFQGSVIQEAAPRSEILHPLLHHNISTLKEQKYTSSFTGNEFFLMDHKVGEQKILPGVAYLEMARIAGEIAGEQSVSHLRNVVWSSPVIVEDAPVKVYVGVYPDENGLMYEMATFDENESKNVHAQGKMGFATYLKDSCNPETLNIAEIQKRCFNFIDQESCYLLFRKKGFDYGPGFKGISHLFSNESEALSKLILPEKCKAHFKDYILHPSLMDGALQTIIGLLGDAKADPLTYIPFTMGELCVFSHLPETCYVHVSMPDVRVSDPSLKKFNLQITDLEGRILISIKEFTARAFLPGSTRPKTPPQKTKETMYYQNLWEKSAILPLPHLDPMGLILLFDTTEEMFRLLQNRLSGKKDVRLILVKPGKTDLNSGDGIFEIDPFSQKDYQTLAISLKIPEFDPLNIIHMWSNEGFSFNETIIQQQLDRGLYSVFFLTQALMQHHSKAKIHFTYLYPSPPNEPQPQ